MAEPLLPIDELRALRFSVASLATLCGDQGSYDRENATNVSVGIKHRLDWVIRQLEAAKEGHKNMGA